MASNNRPLVSLEYYCFDLIVNNKGFSLQLTVAVDVIDADSANGSLILLSIVGDLDGSSGSFRYA